MMKKFLTDEQIETLKKKKWKVNPKGAYLTIYRDDFGYINENIWEQICQQVGADESKADKIDILYFATITNK